MTGVQTCALPIYAGTFLRQHLDKPARVRLFNRVMAALLVASAAYLLLT